MLDNPHKLSPAQAHWSLLVCFLYVALAGLLGSLAQLCSLEIQLLHALETALQFPRQFCSTCMTAIALSMDDVEHKSLQCWALTVDKWLQITCHQQLVLFLMSQYCSSVRRSCGSPCAAANLKDCRNPYSSCNEDSAGTSP